MISVIIPCYNCQKTIDRAVKSVLAQTYSALEIILVDDGAEDSTPLICDMYATQYTHIKVIHQRNSGLMKAWKNGVLMASGDYIGFVDADDYVSENWLEHMNASIENFSADIILYGGFFEYNDNRKIYAGHRLKSGLYDRKMIEDAIYPFLYSNGGMETDLIAKSRCFKLFKRDLLVRIMDDLPNNISVGEDDLTTFCAILNATSIYGIDNYPPFYHYVRNAESMIGAYDKDVFDKIGKLAKAKVCIAKKYGYTYESQIKADIFSLYILYVKKEICRSGLPIGRLVKLLKERRNSELFKSIEDVSIKKYKTPERLFAQLYIDYHFGLLILITRFVSRLYKCEL